jgi:hypothetical protein
MRCPHKPEPGGRITVTDNRRARLFTLEERQMSATATIAKVCAELQGCQRQRARLIHSRIMAENNRRSYVANQLGYSNGLSEGDRKAMFAEADEIIAGVVDDDADHDAAIFIRAAELGIAAFGAAQKSIEKDMLRLAKELPVAEWIERPEQRGFGLSSLAVVVGETGDLTATAESYGNPAKVWRRMGLAPWTHDGETRMGAAWKSHKLPADQWSLYGYSPRRRSIMFNIGECLIKAQGKGAEAGPYRRRYEEAKAKAEAARPEWGVCPVCKGSGKTARAGKCGNCNGTGRVAMHYHRHASLLMVKLLLRELWRAWNPAADRPWSPN